MSSFLKIALVLYLTFLAWTKVIYEADRLYVHPDELSDTLAAVHLFQEGEYWSSFFEQGQRFGPTLSAGIASSWSAGLAWISGASLFESRLLLASVAWLSALLLCFLFFKSLPVSVFAWLLSLQTAYWYGFVLNLGELTGALFLGFGLLCFEKRKALAYALFGVAVWSCTSVYLPVCLFWIGLSVLFLRRSSFAGVGAGAEADYESSRFLSVLLSSRRLALALVFFLLPLVVWLGFMTLRYDLSSTGVWLERFVANRIGGFGVSALDGGLGISAFLARLDSPSLAWSSFDWADRIRILSSFLVPFGLLTILSTYFGLYGFGQRHMLRTRLVWGACMGLGFYGIWYFFLSPNMGLLQAQSSAYLGLGFSFFLAREIWNKMELRRRMQLKPVWMSLLVLILAQESVTMMARFPLLEQGRPSYARSCIGELDRHPCVPKDWERGLKRVPGRM